MCLSFGLQVHPCLTLAFYVHLNYCSFGSRRVIHVLVHVGTRTRVQVSRVYLHTEVEVFSNKYIGIQAREWYMRYHGCEAVARMRALAITATLTVDGGSCALRAQVQR